MFFGISPACCPGAVRLPQPVRPTINQLTPASDSNVCTRTLVFGTDRARFRAGHSITLVQRDFTGDAALDWGCAGLRFSDRGALRFRVSGKYQGETHNKTQDQTHSDHSKTLCNDLRVHRATLRMCLTMRYLDV